MRILHLTPRYYPARGGAEHYWREISVRLAARGHKVTVVSSDADHFEYFWDRRLSKIPARLDQDGAVRILRLPVRHWPGGQWSYRGLRRLLWLANEAGWPTRQLRRLARLTPRMPALWHYLQKANEPYDLVAAINIAYESFGLAGQQFAERRKIPFVYYPLTHLGAGPAPGTDVLSRFYTQRHQLELARTSTALVTITPTEADYYEQNGVPHDQIRVAEPGFSLPREVAVPAERRTRPTILFLGTMSGDKGTPHLLAAARSLRAAGCDFDLVLAGRPTQPFLQSLAALPLSERDAIELKVDVSEAEKAALLTRANVLVLPSRVESFGIVFQEAWAYRKPVIAARTWGISDDVVRDERDGLVVEFGDVAGLAAAIKRLLQEPELARRLGQHGYETLAQRYNWSDKIDTIEALYQGLV